MDFIEGFPCSGSVNCLMVVVDKFSKFAYFVPLLHLFLAQQVAQLFLDNVYRLHGLPTHIISDCDRIFTSTFWCELFRIAQTSLSMSSAYHPQSDGQTECVNQCLETFLRYFVHSFPKKWSRWVSFAEFWYNTSPHSSLGRSPFKVLYGHPLATLVLLRILLLIFLRSRLSSLSVLPCLLLSANIFCAPSSA